VQAKGKYFVKVLFNTSLEALFTNYERRGRYSS
jgi:hypothetical protein